MTPSISMNLRVAVAATLLAATAIASAQQASPFAWQTVANNKSCIPDDPKGRTFNSYGQPSVNASGLVVFRGRSTGAEGSGEPGLVSSNCEKFDAAANGPARGVYARDMNAGLSLREVGAVGDPVPEPNNTNYNSMLASFNEFPAFPRIDITSDAIATRGQSQPVWEYPVGDTNNDGVIETTKVGTSGIYVDRASTGMWATGASQLGIAPGMERFAVPVATGVAPNTKFDQFPGSPGIMSRSVIAFKGNFTDTKGTPETEDDVGYTGVFLRDVRASQGLSPVQLVASSVGTDIPNTSPATKFGSTAPPSAAGGYVFFVGSDNEESPSFGGMYRASIKAPTTLVPLVEIGKPVKGMPIGFSFSKIGESLSVSARGRQIAFWGSWGTDTVEVQLKCPTDGKLAEECLKSYPEGSDYHPMILPKNQGIFVYDSKAKTVRPVATTDGGEYEQFLYCIFSGKPADIGQGSEGTGHSEADSGGDHGDGGTNEEPGADGEPARWRCSSFAALSGLDNDWYQVAFKANKIDGETGIYLWDSANKPTETVIKVGDPAKSTDPDAPSLDPDAPDGAVVTTIGIERDGFRMGWLGITAGMLNAATTESMAGVYVTRVPGWDTLELNTLLQQLATQ